MTKIISFDPTPSGPLAPARVTAALFISWLAISLGLDRTEATLQPFIDALAKMLAVRDRRISELAQRAQEAEQRLAALEPLPGREITPNLSE